MKGDHVGSHKGLRGGGGGGVLFTFGMKGRLCLNFRLGERW